MNRISRSAASLRRAGRLVEVGGEQRLLVGLVELVVDREVGEVEVAVAHPRVLPVDDPEALAVGDEVGREQVVVAGHGLVLGAGERRLDLRRARRAPRS